MRAKAAETLSLGLLLASLCGNAFAGKNQSFQLTLNSAYRGKILTLRHSYSASTIVYDLDGKVRSGGTPGSWTFDGLVEVQSVVLNHDRMSLNCNRVEVAFTDKRARLFKGGDVEIDVVGGGKPLTPDNLDHALAKIFLSPGEKLSKVAPSYWKPFFASHKHLFERLQIEVSQFNNSSDQHEKMTTPPTLVPESEPHLGSQAELNGRRATLLLKIFLDRSGHVEGVIIQKPVGLGLDDKAVKVVRKWRFTRGSSAARLLIVEIKYKLKGSASVGKRD